MCAFFIDTVSKIKIMLKHHTDGKPKSYYKNTVMILPEIVLAKTPEKERTDCTE
jgi:hypothetical protein